MASPPRPTRPAKRGLARDMLPGIRCKGTVSARQRKGFSRDKSLERVRAEPAVAVLKDIAAREESGKPAVAPPSTLTGPRPVIQSFQCNEFSNRNHIA